MPPCDAPISIPPMQVHHVEGFALAGEEVVGWCDVQPHGSAAHSHRGSLGMGPTGPLRGRRLGRRLIEQALERAWKIGLTRVELSVHVDTVAAIALYRKAGFEEEGRMRGAFLADGIHRDAVMMAILRSAARASVEGEVVS